MKTVVFLLFFFPLALAAQEPNQPTSETANSYEVVSKSDAPSNDPAFIHHVVDEPAEFPGGMKAFREFLVTNLNYPEKVSKEAIRGKCYFRFTVETEGTISEITLQKGVPNCPECDAEALRVLRTMPNWKPGILQGKAVRSYFTFPITFARD